MASLHLPSTSLFQRDLTAVRCEASRAAASLAPLSVMDTNDTAPATIELLTLQQGAEILGCSVKTLYDLRTRGRGPRGFRLGTRLMFRRSEIETWLARLEQADGCRHGIRDHA